jgi:hypothetical protein
MAADRHRVIGLVALVAVLGLAGCGGSDSKQADQPLLGRKGAAEVGSSTTTTSTTAPGDIVEAAILHDYAAGWQAFEQAMDPPNPDLPALAATSTGRALDQTRKYLGEIRSRGNVLRGTLELDPRVQSHDGPDAVVLDCIKDSTTEMKASSTEKGGRVERVGWQVRMKLFGDHWVQEALFESEAACAGR